MATEFHRGELPQQLRDYLVSTGISAEHLGIIEDGFAECTLTSETDRTDITGFSDSSIRYIPGETRIRFHVVFFSESIEADEVSYWLMGIVERWEVTSMPGSLELKCEFEGTFTPSEEPRVVGWASGSFTDVSLETTDVSLETYQPRDDDPIEEEGDELVEIFVLPKGRGISLKGV